MYETQTSENWSRMITDEGTRTVIQKSSGILTGVPFVHDSMYLIQTIPWAAAKVTVSQPSADHCVT